ncbi:MAG: hypothetical protein WCV68_04525 [Candidatus Paceibacterota bacterium]|jgi:hypothetical protein
MKSLIIAQFIVLLAGTLFAWGNFIYELINWLNNKACTTGCAQGLVNPFFTPCFYGALFFTISFVLSCLILMRA